MNVINVMMFGGRRCGKTSVIAAMKGCFEDVFGENTNLDINISDIATMNVIDEKSAEINQYFVNKTRSIVMNKSYAATQGLMEYKLDICIKGKDGTTTLNLCDFPGEWLDKNHQDEQKTLQSKIEHCNIIIIAIDTVYLMEKAANHKAESVGQYNERRNYCNHVANMVKDYFQVADGEPPKMIMFVPLKCEKYYNNGEMELVKGRIHTAYKEIFNFAEDNKDKYEIIIAPILTLGKNTAEFSRFEYGDDGEIMLDKDLMIPSMPKYIFKDISCSYSPKYCEQPLLYTLAYILDLMQKAKNSEKVKAGLLKKFKLYILETYYDLASAQDFLEHKKIITGQLKIDNDGYEIISDPLQLKEMTV